MTEYDAVVYDLDGTLVRLGVDWASVREELGRALAEEGLDTGGRDVWDLLKLSDAEGLRDVAEDVIGHHERDGARQSDRLPLADDLPLSVPVGICSLNCEAACRLALETHQLRDHVGEVVGRDSVGRYKPDPEPLRAVLAGLGVEPTAALFVGDSESDKTTARAAGVDFQWVGDRLDAA